MNKFLKQYLKIIKTVSDKSLLGKDTGSDGEYTELSPLIMENLYFEAIDENEFSELAPVPKSLLNYLYSKIRTKNDKAFKFLITYSEIFELLKQYQYKDIYNFKLALQLLKVFDSGVLVIGVSDCIKEDKENKVYKKK